MLELHLGVFRTTERIGISRTVFTSWHREMEAMQYHLAQLDFPPRNSLGICTLWDILTIDWMSVFLWRPELCAIYAG